jgi:collagenase-like PrtC family protease
VWRSAIDRAADSGVDAVTLADPCLMGYALKHHPQLRLHLSVQGSATNYEAINFYHQHFGISRAVLPRVLSLSQVEQVMDKTPVEIEVFGFGSLCVMVEGRCALSSYVTGEAPNTNGV